MNLIDFCFISPLIISTDSRPSTKKTSPAAGRRQAGTLRADFPARASRISTYMADMALAQFFLGQSGRFTLLVRC
jgi:hypothetical protein